MTFTRKLGRSGIEISALWMGCWAIGGPFWSEGTPPGWGEVDDNESLLAIQRALDLGVTFFDTANVYGTGHSERILGKAFAGKRQEVVIATKFNALFDEERREVTGASCTPEEIRQACEDLLRRLDTDYIDLYQFHDNGYPAKQAEPVRETLEGLVKEGKPNPDFLKKIETLREILTSHGRTLPQSSLAWLWARSEQAIPIPGFRTVQQVEENCSTLEHGPLTRTQVEDIETLLHRK